MAEKYLLGQSTLPRPSERLSKSTPKDADIGVNIHDVRRQSFWNQKRRELRECSAHRVGLIMLRVDCDASVALRMSSV